jgi:hypothetical protein
VGSTASVERARTIIWKKASKLLLKADYFRVSCLLVALWWTEKRLAHPLPFPRQSVYGISLDGRAGRHVVSPLDAII